MTKDQEITQLKQTIDQWRLAAEALKIALETSQSIIAVNEALVEHYQKDNAELRQQLRAGILKRMDADVIQLYPSETDLPSLTDAELQKLAFDASTPDHIAQAAENELQRRLAA